MENVDCQVCKETVPKDDAVQTNKTKVTNAKITPLFKCKRCNLLGANLWRLMRNDGELKSQYDNMSPESRAGWLAKLRADGAAPQNGYD